MCNDTLWFAVVFKHAHYLNSLFSDGRVGVCEAMDYMRENLGIDCCLIQILNELLHLRQRDTEREKKQYESKSVFLSRLTGMYIICS